MGLMSLKLITSSETSFIKNEYDSLYKCLSQVSNKKLIFSFFDRFVTLYLYRIPFFNFLKKESINKNGNFIYEVQDSLIFPELE